MKSYNLIFARVCFKIGFGASVSFWNDTWLREDTMANRFPLLCALTHDKHAAVSHLGVIG